MQKFPEIEGLHQIVKMLDKYPQYTPDKPVVYKGKIKLHGTNGGIVIHPDGKVVAQSREAELVNGADNAGFAKWVASHESEFSRLKGEKVVTIFGEWCGQGIQKGCAIHQVTEKQFAVFAIQLGVTAGEGEPDTTTWFVDPSFISEWLGQHGIIFVKVLPWYAPAEITLDYSSKEQLREQAEKINALVTEVEKCDPWVKEVFGVEGIGEGIVYYPTNLEYKRSVFSYFLFKAKGDKHKVVAQKTAVQVDPTVAKNIEEFVTLFVTENRCQQGLDVACGGQLDRKLTGQFLKWLCSDVLKESKTELEASNLSWDDVKNAVQKAAQKWWLNKTATI